MPHSHHQGSLLLLPLIALILAGCAGSPASRTSTNPTPAAHDTMQAVHCLDAGDWSSARALLEAALRADPYFGPAHNNMGVVHLHHAQLARAADHFETARKLMPGHPDPRVNLALVYEAAGRSADAIAAYRAALDIQPDYLPAMQGLARALLRDDSAAPGTPRSSELRSLLQHLALAADPAWQQWARLRLIKNHDTSPPSARTNQVIAPIPATSDNAPHTTP